MLSVRSSTGAAIRTVRWPLGIAIATAVFFIVGLSTARETYRVWQVDQEIKTLQNQIDQLQGKKLALSEWLNKLSSLDELDKQARTHLGLKKPGEQMMIIHGVAATTLDQPSVDSGQAVESHSNPKKWFRYFFQIK